MSLSRFNFNKLFIKRPTSLKDNFSTGSDKYARYRPRYPKAFFDYLYTLVTDRNVGWDCGTGNGQVAAELAKEFRQIYATDISQSQMNQAPPRANVSYSVQPSEHTSFSDDTFNLIIVAQAIHWFDFGKFYNEVKRTGKDGAILCVLGYARPVVSPQIDAIVTDFYIDVVGPYWDKERRYIDEDYKTIPFPFEEVPTPQFQAEYNWDLPHLVGYIGTWSAVKHFIAQRNYDPLADLAAELGKVWLENATLTVSFPLLLRIGKIEK
jgi:SAM-dependent methyltransferase